MELKPGMVCDVKLDANEKCLEVTVPFQSVDKDDNNNNYVYVFNVATKTVTKRLVKVGNYEGDCVEILSGVNVGEKVVSSGMHKLSDGCKVTL
jgi:multidrug efflux pump subunit AcrA (membrane-fusion protein)